MELTPRQYRALCSICDTFLPAAPGWPSAVEHGVPAALATALDYNPRAVDRWEFLNLLDVWDSSLHSFVEVGNWSQFSKLPYKDQQKILLSWADSRLSLRRAAFQALRKAAGFLYVMLPGEANETNSVWQNMGYPGPIGVQRPNAAKKLSVTVPQTEMTLSCDVCVIGSGAGGGVAAAVLAAAGKDVIVVEAGGYFDDADFDGAELAGFKNLYSECGFASTRDHSVGFLAGECLGGGTVVNYCTSFRTPLEIREEWAGAGVEWMRGAEFAQSLGKVCARLNVNQAHNHVSKREEILERGLRRLGWHVDAMPRNVIGCDQGKVCGYCGYGCAIGAKQSTVKTWLADAQAHGAKFVVETRAERVRVERGVANGVEARTKNGHRVIVKCKSVVVACGAIHTAALLLRSGLENAHIGRHLHLHPVSNVCGVFDEEIRPWEGTMQAIYSDEHRYLTGNYGVKYETTALQPVIAMAVMPWREPQDFRTRMSQLKNTAAIGVLLRDRGEGRVTTDREGHPVSSYTLSDFDRRHMQRGFRGAAEILESAGAKRIYSPHAKLCSYEPGRKGSVESFARDMDAAGWGNAQLALFSFHIMGTVRLGDSPGISATDPDGETWEVKNLYVMDGSSFPSASGVNPMISIEAIAHRNATVLASKAISG
jgi:choline dehydrogenase-like flavoprotein